MAFADARVYDCVPSGREIRAMLLLILGIVLVLSLAASLPAWPRSKHWGSYPNGAVSLVWLVLLVMFFLVRF